MLDTFLHILGVCACVITITATCVFVMFMAKLFFYHLGELLDM